MKKFIFVLFFILTHSVKSEVLDTSFYEYVNTDFFTQAQTLERTQDFTTARNGAIGTAIIELNGLTSDFNCLELTPPLNDNILSTEVIPGSNGASDGSKITRFGIYQATGHSNSECQLGDPNPDLSAQSQYQFIEFNCPSGKYDDVLQQCVPSAQCNDLAQTTSLTGFILSPFLPATGCYNDCEVANPVTGIIGITIDDVPSSVQNATYSYTGVSCVGDNTLNIQPMIADVCPEGTAYSAADGTHRCNSDNTGTGEGNGQCVDFPDSLGCEEIDVSTITEINLPSVVPEGETEKTFSTILEDFNTRVSQTDLYTSISTLEIPETAGTCPIMSLTIPLQIFNNHTFVMDNHCDLFEQFRTQIGILALFIFSVTGLFILLDSIT